MSTRAEILAEIAAQFPDNTTGLITPAKLRQVVEDVTNSCLVSDTDAGTAGIAVLQAETPAQLRAVAGSAGLAVANEFTAQQAIRRDSIGAVNEDGLVLRNATAAAVGAQQFSPALVLEGQGWGTTAGASQQCKHRIGLRPQQSGVANGSLYFSASSNGSAYADYLNITSSGTAIFSGNITGQAITANNGVSLSKNFKDVSTDGLAMNNSANATASFQQSYTPRIYARGSAWNGTAAETDAWVIEGRPIPVGSGNTSMNWVVGMSINAGNFLDKLTLGSDGLLTLSGSLKLANSYVAGAPTATGYLTLQDATGTTYKIPAVAA